MNTTDGLKYMEGKKQDMVVRAYNFSTAETEAREPLWIPG